MAASKPAGSRKRPRGATRKSDAAAGSALEHFVAVAAATAATCIMFWTLPHLIAPRAGWSPLLPPLVWALASAGFAIGAAAVGPFTDRLTPRPFVGGLFLAASLAIIASLMLHRSGPVAHAGSSGAAFLIADAAALALAPGIALGAAATALTRLLLTQAKSLHRGAARLVAAVAVGVTAGWALCELVLRATTPHTVAVETAAGILAAPGLWHLTALLISTEPNARKGASGPRELPAKERKLLKAETPGGTRVALGTVCCVSAGAAALLTAFAALAQQTVPLTVFDAGAIVTAAAMGFAIGAALGARGAAGPSPRGATSRALTWTVGCTLVAAALHHVLLETDPFGGTLPDTVRTPVYLLAVFALPALALGAAIPPLLRWTFSVQGPLGGLIGSVLAAVATGALAGGVTATLLLPGWLGPIGVLGLTLLAIGVGAWWFAPNSPLAIAAVIAGGAGCLLMTWDGPPLRDVAELLRLREQRPAGLVGEAHGRDARARILDDPIHPGVQRLLVNTVQQDVVYLPDPTRLLTPRDIVTNGALAEWRPEPAPVHAVAIGDVSVGLAQRIVTRRPGSDVTVVGIDPAVRRVASIAWERTDRPEIRALQVDPRVHFTMTTKDGATTPYDLALHAMPRIGPAQMHLVTREFVERAAAGLAEDGLYIVSIADRLPDARRLAALAATLQSAFDHVVVLATAPRDAPRREPFVLAASKRPINGVAVIQRLRAAYAGFDGALLLPEEVDALLERTGARPFTDEWAPVRLYEAMPALPELSFERMLPGIE